jgi:tubulin polyglutamylase TTLL9
MFVEEFKKHSGSTWIMKPIGKSQGTGIFLVNKLAQLHQWRPATTWAPPKGKVDKDRDDDIDNAPEGPELYVVQKYVEGPLVIGGKKFDIRMYVLVTGYTPLTVYMHRGGFCRFSMSRYSHKKNDMNDLGAHLTNIAVQKHSGKAAYKRTGAKWDVQRLKTYLTSTAGIDVTNRLFIGIESIVIDSLLAVQKVMINDKHCFELYGYDILIDVDYRPWLLEVNASPSLTANTVDDYMMKFGMLDDTLSILDIEHYLSGDELQVGGFDLLYRDGYRYSPPLDSEIQSYLGCSNNRSLQMKKLAKTRAWELGREGRNGGGAAPAEDQRPEAIASRNGRYCRRYPSDAVGTAAASTEVRGGHGRPASRAD